MEMRSSNGIMIEIHQRGFYDLKIKIPVSYSDHELVILIIPISKRDNLGDYRNKAKNGTNSVKGR